MNATSPGTRKERALELLRANRLEEARDLCDEVARTENSVGAWHLLGVIHGMLGDVREAERCSRAATDLKPDYADAHANLGIALRLQGKLDEAIASLREAVRLKPDHAEAHYQLGMALAADQRMDEAIVSLSEAVRRRPDNTDAHVYLGAAQAAIGQFDKAATNFREGLRLNPRHVDARIYLGNVLVDLGQFEESAEQYRRALEIDPTDAELLVNFGNVLSELDRKEEAITAYRQAINHDARFAGAYHNLGHVLLDMDRTGEAIKTYRAALQTNPGHPVLLADLGVALSRENKHDQAAECYRQALSIDPNDAETYYNLANALWALGKFGDAVESYQTAIRLQPNDADAHVNLGLVHLSLRNFREGWREYDWQWRREGAPSRPFPPSSWDGTGLGGRTVFLHDEQGLGDELFFLRFVSWLRNRDVGKIVYRPSVKLASLVARVPILDRIAAQNERPPDSAIILSVGDLPRLLGMERTDAIPPPVALTPFPALLTAQRKKLDECGPPPYLGVTWRAGTTRKNALHKKSPLSGMAQVLKDVPGTVLVLQRHPRAGEIDQFSSMLGRPAHDFSSLNEDLEQMLALLSLIDEYVGVSNTNMHLRAAVGRTAKVLVPAPPEWRWMAEGKESPWFPGFSVYRQGYDGSWGEALTDLGHDLAAALPAR